LATVYGGCVPTTLCFVRNPPLQTVQGEVLTPPPYLKGVACVDHHKEQRTHRPGIHTSSIVSCDGASSCHGTARAFPAGASKEAQGTGRGARATACDHLRRLGPRFCQSRGPRRWQGLGLGLGFGGNTQAQGGGDGGPHEVVNWSHVHQDMSVLMSADPCNMTPALHATVPLLSMQYYPCSQPKRGGEAVGADS
jgi:hypothetical protein